MQDKWEIVDGNKDERCVGGYYLIHYNCDTIFYPSDDRCDCCYTTIPNHIKIQLDLLNGK